MHPAIRVDQLGKRYKIGVREKAHQSFREALVDLATAPLRRLRTLGEAAREEETFWALRNMSFEVAQGEVVGIIGRNGAGKSTLLKVLSRITEPTEGRVELRGRVASLLEVGTGFHPELTGRENVYLNGAILGMRKTEIDRRFDEIVQFAEIDRFLDTPVKRYSSGMYVRLAFAVAAHLEPEILIVDEVLAVGDHAFQQKCLGKMGAVAGTGRTVLFVSHNMAAVEQLCTKVLWVDQGILEAEGPSTQVISSYIQSTAQQASARFALEEDTDAARACGAVLLEAEILDSNLHPTSSLKFGEPFGVRLKVRLERTIRGVSFSLRFSDALGRFIFAVNTIGQDLLAIHESGVHELTCRFGHSDLAPGIYRVSVGAWVRPRTEVFLVDPCLSIAVEDIAHDPSHRFAIKGNPVIAPRAFWTYCDANCDAEAVS